MSPVDRYNFTIVDVETTGGNPIFDRVIDVGVLRVEKGEVVETFETLVNPGIEIPEFITKMTGISSHDVIDAPIFDDIKDRILTLCEDSVFVAHNALFDYGFLQSEFERVGYAFNTSKLCTVRLSRVLYPEYKRHNLTELIQRFNFECKRRHRAFDDAKVLWDFLQLVSNNFPQEDLDLVLRRTLKELSPSSQRKLGKVEEILYESELE